MPIYEYDCNGCSKTVEVLLLRKDEHPECPECGSDKLEKLMSVPASPSTGSSSRSLPMASSGEACGAPRCCGGGCNS